MCKHGDRFKFVSILNENSGASARTWTERETTVSRPLEKRTADIIRDLPLDLSLDRFITLPNVRYLCFQIVFHRRNSM